MDEFMSIPELQQNPLVRRVIDILDTDRNGEVDFQGVWRVWALEYEGVGHGRGCVTVGSTNFYCRVHPWRIAVQCKGREGLQTAL